MAMVNVSDGGSKKTVSSGIKSIANSVTKNANNITNQAKAQVAVAKTKSTINNLNNTVSKNLNKIVPDNRSIVTKSVAKPVSAINNVKNNMTNQVKVAAVKNDFNKVAATTTGGVKTAVSKVNDSIFSTSKSTNVSGSASNIKLNVASSVSSGCSSATSKISSYVTDAGKKVEVSKIDKNGNIISKTAIDKNGNVVYSDSIKSSGCGSYSTTGCGVVKPKSEIKPITTDKKSDKRPPAISGCASHTTVTTGCSGIKTADIKEKKVKIPLTTSKGKNLSDKAKSFIKGGAAITAGGVLAGPAGVAVATTVVAGKTLVANAPALRENANKAKQIAQDLLSGLKKSQQTLDTLHEKWQGSDANKYIESTKEKLKNLEIISQVMELYQKTSEQAARKVEETQHIKRIKFLETLHYILI